MPKSDSPSGAASKAKLPRLTIQPFSEELTNLMISWDSYKMAIKQGSRSSTTYTVATGTSTQGYLWFYTLSAANYKEVVDILCKRFSNKQVIITKHMGLLVNLEPVTSDHHLRGLHKLYDSIESHFVC